MKNIDTNEEMQEFLNDILIIYNEGKKYQKLELSSLNKRDDEKETISVRDRSIGNLTKYSLLFWIATIGAMLIIKNLNNEEKEKINQNKDKIITILQANSKNLNFKKFINKDHFEESHNLTNETKNKLHKIFKEISYAIYNIHKNEENFNWPNLLRNTDSFEKTIYYLFDEYISNESHIKNLFNGIFI